MKHYHLILFLSIFILSGITCPNKQKMNDYRNNIYKKSFNEDGCNMSDKQVNINSSCLTLTVDKDNASKPKPFNGGEVFSKNDFLYGEFKVSIKNSIAPGSVSSFFLMNQWEEENWEHKEIDIEFLGKDTRAVQFTVHHYKNGGKNHVYKKHIHDLGFDSSDDFHEYKILWSEDSISWFVDNKWVYSEKELLIHEKLHIRMNHWAADPDRTEMIKWLGPLDLEVLSSTVYYDYVTYTPL